LIQAVIFDMDGVLVDSYAPHLESWRVLANEIGASITDEQFDHTFGRTSRDIIRMLFGATDDETVHAYDERKEALYRDLVREAVPGMPGAVELVGSLATAGLGLAVGTSGPRANVDLVCAAMGLDDLLKVRVTKEDVRRGKPDPEIFLTAAAKLGVAPACCVVIEDAPAGIQAARSGGMRCIAMTSTHESGALSEADAVVDSLADAGAVIARWRDGSPGSQVVD